MRLIFSKKHRPFGIAAPHSVYEFPFGLRFSNEIIFAELRNLEIYNLSKDIYFMVVMFQLAR